VDAEVLHGAEVGKRLHQRERDPARDRRAGQRHRDREEAAPGAAAQRPAHVEHAGALLEERGAGEQIDVRIEHEAHDHDGAPERADRREPVVGVGPAGRLAQQALHRPGVLEKIGVGVADDVGRDGERQQQRPFEQAAAREVAHADQPRRADPDHQDAAADAQRERERVAQIAREHGAGQVRPDLAARRQQAGQHD
jgi:hypothetical protein